MSPKFSEGSNSPTKINKRFNWRGACLAGSSLILIPCIGNWFFPSHGVEFLPSRYVVFWGMFATQHFKFNVLLLCFWHHWKLNFTLISEKIFCMNLLVICQKFSILIFTLSLNCCSSPFVYLVRLYFINCFCEIDVSFISCRLFHWSNKFI